MNKIQQSSYFLPSLALNKPKASDSPVGVLSRVGNASLSNRVYSRRFRHHHVIASYEGELFSLIQEQMRFDVAKFQMKSNSIANMVDRFQHTISDVEEAVNHFDKAILDHPDEPYKWKHPKYFVKKYLHSLGADLMDKGLPRNCLLIINSLINVLNLRGE